MPGCQPQLPPEIPKLKQPHYVHDYVDLDYYPKSHEKIFKSLDATALKPKNPWKCGPFPLR